MNTTATPVLQLKEVTKSFGPNRVLDSINLDLFPGEIVAIAGENGSGKSTTARIIAGVLQRDGGDIVVNGKRQNLAGPAQARHLGVCYVGQEPALVPTMSVANNLTLADIRLRRRKNPIERPENLLRRVGLDCGLSQRVSTLSAAAKTQLEIAKALRADPRILILDEVTTRMPDPATLLDLVAALADLGVSTILITHRFNEIKTSADRAVVLRDGHIAGELSGASVTDARLGEMMVGRKVSLLERRESSRREGVALRINGLRATNASSPIDFSVHKGEIVGVGGLMGSGRSRLLEMVAGARKPAAGQVVVDGVTLRPGSVTSARAAKLGFVPEDRDRQGLIRQATISANIRLNAYSALQLPNAKTDRAIVAQLCELLKIKTPSLNARVETLSGGNAQKIVFARQLSQVPDVFILDEPTRGVDIAARSDIYALIRSRVDNGSAVLLASSDLQELTTLCDRVFVLYEGAIAGELEGDHINDEDIILLASGANLIDTKSNHTDLAAHL